MGDDRITNRAGPENRVGPEKRSLTDSDLADEWHQKHPKGEPDPRRTRSEVKYLAWKQVDSGEVQRLLKEVAGLAQRNRERFERVENLQEGPTGSSP